MIDTITVSKLENQIKILNYELSKSNIRFKELENTLLKQQKENMDLKVLLKESYLKETENKNMREALKEKDNIILDLENKIEKLINDIKTQKKEFDIKYRNDVGEVRFLNEKLSIRNESAIKFEKLNDILYDRVQQLEQTILNLKNEEKRKFQEQEIKFERKLVDTKKKMLNFINEAKSIKDNNLKTKFEVIEKLSIMNHNSLLNELEFGSLQLEDLLKQREHLDKVIVQMKSDLLIHKNVEKVLVNKNKKYVDMIRVLSEKIEKDKKEKEIEKQKSEEKIIKMNDSNIDFDKKKEKHFLYNKIKKNIDSNKRYLDYKNDFNKSQPNFNKDKIMIKKRMIFTNYTSRFLQRNDSLSSFEYKTKNDKIIFEKIQLQKELIKKTKEIDILRDNCNHYKDKLNFIDKRYFNILCLYDTVLEKINKEYQEDLKEIYIDINEFNKCEFDKLTIDKKYSLAILLIKCILPLINENNLPENIKKNMKNIQTKFYLNNETCDSSCRGKKYNSSFIDLNMKENEKKLREIKDGTWTKFKIKNLKINNNRKEKILK